jgi:hypothetical protein
VAPLSPDREESGVISRPHDQARRIGAILVALAAFGVVCWFSLGMHRGLLLSSDVKSRCWPWAPAYPPTALQAPILTDPVWQFVPWLGFARGELLAGRVPLWNPHEDGGVPLLANPMVGLGSPLVSPVLLFGVGTGWNLSLLARILLAAAAMYLFLRDLGRSTAAAALGSVMFSLSGPFVAWLENPNSMVMAPVPLLLLACRRLAARATVPSVLGMVAATYLVVVGGHPETTAMVAVVAAGWVAATAPSIRRAIVPIGAAVLGLALAAPFLVPFAEYLRLSAAAQGEGRGAFTLPVAALARFLTPHAGPGNPVTEACTVSVVGLVLVLVGISTIRRSRVAAYWAVVAAAVPLVAYANPFARWLASHTPVYWTRALIVLPVALAPLAAAGLDAVRERLRAAGSPRWADAVAAVVVLIAAVELLRAASGVHAVTPAAEVARSTPILERLAAEREPFRILPLHTFLPPNSATAYGLDDVRGYDALAPLAWRRERAAVGRFTGTSYVSDVLEPWDLVPGGRALDEWNVKYLLLHPQMPYDAARLNRELGLDLEEVYLGFDGRLLRNRRVLPRARLLGSGTVTVVKRTPVRWDLSVDAGERSTLILADPMFPGWKAELDGRRVAISSPNGKPIEVSVPGGSHVVVIRYRPLSLRIGLVLAALGIGGTVTMAWGCRRRRRDRESPRGDGQEARGAGT